MKKFIVLGMALLLPMFAYGEELTAYEIASRSYRCSSKQRKIVDRKSRPLPRF